MSNNLLEKTFQILAVILFGIAAFFLWQENSDGIFVSAVLACISFLLSHRFQLKERLDKRKAERLEKEFADENYRESLFEADFAEDELADFELDDDREEILVER